MKYTEKTRMRMMFLLDKVMLMKNAGIETYFGIESDGMFRIGVKQGEEYLMCELTRDDLTEEEALRLYSELEKCSIAKQQ